MKTNITMRELGKGRPKQVFVGSVVYKDEGDEFVDNQAYIVTKVNASSVSGLKLDGDFDCMYRYTNIVRASTRKGFRYSKKLPLRFVGHIDGKVLAEAIEKADTGKMFGSGKFHSA